MYVISMIHLSIKIISKVQILLSSTLIKNQFRPPVACFVYAGQFKRARLIGYLPHIPVSYPVRDSGVTTLLPVRFYYSLLPGFRLHVNDDKLHFYA